MVVVPEIDALRRTAEHLAQAAAALVRTRREQEFPRAGGARGVVATKTTPTDPVTVVDHESEQLIRSLLARLHPGARIVGEEGDGDSSAVEGAGDDIVWVVDPIDGTVNFVYGIPAYAVSVAAMRAGRSVAAAVVDVAANVTYSAGLGAGATAIGADGVAIPLRCNDVDTVKLALLATGFGYGAPRRARQGQLVAAVLPRVRDIRRVGSAALDLCMVATGRVDAHYEHGLQVWDWAAGALIAAEAGARLRLPPAGVGADAGELVVAAAAGIADELNSLFEELGVTQPIPAPTWR